MIQSSKILRLILGDQLNPSHSWFSSVDSEVVYLMLEMRQETDYVLHHAQKILAIFAGMRAFAQSLQRQGHRIHYVKIEHSESRQQLTEQLSILMRYYKAQELQWQQPDEWRLEQGLAEWARQQKFKTTACCSEHFFTERHEVGDFFAKRKHWLMETFYRNLRRSQHILIQEDGRPTGGKWNYDHENRKPWRGSPVPHKETVAHHNHAFLWKTITSCGVRSFGDPSAGEFYWPLDRDGALQQLDQFIAHRLVHFGDFEDAMHSEQTRLFHSQLSFALNTKMLHPREVINHALAALDAQQAPLAAVEGFIRQILGWREFIRGVYWAKMPNYALCNGFMHERALPQWFWTGKTHMRCLRYALVQSLQQAYAHHIQRLMIIGNFCLLAGISPQAVHQWYLGVYIDAFEWVELPNTLGMSQFADDGLFATKPYVSSAAYIDRMSNYCSGCFYDKKAKIGPRACPFNALYWDFYLRNADRLQGNIRLALVYKQLARMDVRQRNALKMQAEKIYTNLENL